MEKVLETQFTDIILPILFITVECSEGLFGFACLASGKADV